MSGTKKQRRRIYDDVDARFDCGKPPKNIFVRHGDAIHAVVPSTVLPDFDARLEEWARSVVGDHVRVQFSRNLKDLESTPSDEFVALPDLADAPFQLYEVSSLGELREMQKEYQQ